MYTCLITRVICFFRDDLVIILSNKILIIGGGNIGFNLAKNIEESFESARIKIIEKNKERAEFIANELNNSIIINGDALDEDVLSEANLEETHRIFLLKHASGYIFLAPALTTCTW